jgi:hypothetical protein
MRLQRLAQLPPPTVPKVKGKGKKKGGKKGKRPVRKRRK